MGAQHNVAVRANRALPTRQLGLMLLTIASQGALAAPLINNNGRVKMKFDTRWRSMLAATSLSIGLAACSGADDATDEAGEALDTIAAQVEGAADELSGSANAPTFADGPDVCFKAAAEKLGADAKVAEIASFFSEGPDVDPSEDEPKGQLQTCTVDYQDPEDPRKLLSMRMDSSTGEFQEPQQVEISVSGNAAEFNLDDYLVKLSDVNTSGLAAKLEEQKAKLDEVYSTHAWTGVRLTEPGAFSDVHLIRVDVAGRIEANDIKGDGYAEFSIDGTKTIGNRLVP